MSASGITFDEARERVKEILLETIRKHKKNDFSIFNNRYWYQKALFLIPIAISSALLIITINVGTSQLFFSGLISTLIFILVLSSTNILLFSQVSCTESAEMCAELEKIASDYEEYTQIYVKNRGDSSSNLDASSAEANGNKDQAAEMISLSPPQKANIASGHAHINIVTVFRNKRWQRLPSLLLAEGDVIALMIGDITPGKVHELVASTSHERKGKSATAGRFYKGKLIDKGVKITDSKVYQERNHRSISANSTELLSLSGDIRCFCMAETPIKYFCEDLFSEETVNEKLMNKGTRAYTPVQEINPSGIKAKPSQESFIRSLFFTILQEGMRIFLLAFAIYVIFAIVRLSLLPSARTDWAHTVAIPISLIFLFSFPIGLPFFLLLAESFSMASLLAMTEIILNDKSQKPSLITNPSVQKEYDRERGYSVGESNLASSADEDLSQDEFHDEDIDERAEEIADEVSMKILWSRWLRYVLRVLEKRLGIALLSAIFSPKSYVRPLLPIPMARVRLLEILGAVTMVCFVDDDIICEGYSVAEEIFLLMNHDNEEERGGDGAKGTVLDLHANPEATGSRFEDPLWWKYLPSLKPLGLAALTTHSPIAPSISETISTDHKKIEVALVNHIRRTMPLEALRELAEEIGFGETDSTIFKRVLEMNVIAPGLLDMRLLEDMHAWGQEETRRRGTLTSQVRATVTQDSRSNSLQMMSHGDPSLLLNYCREYWDGSSITPLSTADRKEFLSIYNRWDLEDFDVVAFAYTPIPLNFHQLILQAYQQSTEVNSLVQTSQSSIGLQSNCVFIVDPRTYQDLEKNAFQITKPVEKTAEPLLNKSSDVPEDLAEKNETHMIETLVDDTAAFEIMDGNDDQYFVLSNSLESDNQARDTKSAEMSELMSFNDPNMNDNDKEVEDEQKFDYGVRDVGLDGLDMDSIHLADIADYKKTSDCDDSVTADPEIYLGRADSYTSFEYDTLLVDNKNTIIDGNSFPVHETIDDLAINLDSAERKSNLLKPPSLIKSKSLDGVMSLSSQSRTAELEFEEEINQIDDVCTLQVSDLSGFKDDDHGLPMVATEKETFARPKSKRHIIERSKKVKGLSHSVGATLWPLIRQQIFLGMAASSVPIKAEVPDVMEDLTRSGVRFVYFSARNMRRSKPVAEKIGIQFDWNCAISLRDLDASDEHDPHRYISQYADWDVHARMPHGVFAIKQHLREVDNVPLLVSLYTDATPDTINQMIQVFRKYGEVVLSVGSSYRSHNKSIFSSSDVPVAIAMLPGDEGQIPRTTGAVLKRFPDISESELCKGDILLHFRLVGLGSVPLLQRPQEEIGTASNVDIPFTVQLFPEEEYTPQLRLAALMEAIRFGRVFLLNILQAMAFASITFVSLGMWPLVSCVFPMTVPPYIPPPSASLFLFVHIPLILFAILWTEAPDKSVMKNTPRKNIFSRKDDSRFIMYLTYRSSLVLLSTFITGWVFFGSIFKLEGEQYYQRMTRFTEISLALESCTINRFWLLQDMISCEMLLCLIAQASTLLERGQTLLSLPTPFTHPYFYALASLSIVTHFCFVCIRAYMRIDSVCSDGPQSIIDLDWMVWFVMAVLPAINLIVATSLNKHDDKFYRRFLSFLRLEFDTRLGMHSPR